MSRLRVGWRLAIGTSALLLFAAADAQARRMANGVDFPDADILQNHSLAKSGVRVSRKLYELFGEHHVSAHCHFMNKDGSIGNVTLFSIMYAALRGWGPAALGNKISARQLAINAESESEVAAVFVQYVLKVTNGDVQQALALVKEAERHDAQCLRDELRYRQAEVKLFKDKRLIMYLDADLKWQVLNPWTANLTTAMLAEKVKLLQLSSFWANVATLGYGLTYSQLSARVTAKTSPAPAAPWATRVEPSKEKQQPAPPKQAEARPRVEAPKEPAPSALPTMPVALVEPREIRDVNAELKLAVTKAQQYCVLKAIPHCT